MSQRLENELTAKMERVMMPDPSVITPAERERLGARARWKAKSTVRGIYFMVLSAVLFLFGFGLLVVPIFVLREVPSAWLIAFAALSLVFGFVLGIWGGNAFSGEVSDNESVQQSSALITAIGKAVGFARKGVTNGS